MHLRPIQRRLGAALVICAMAMGIGGGLAPSAGAATTANRNYVRALYSDLLDRPDPYTDSAGMAFWADKLDTDTRDHVAKSIQKAGAEYYGHIVDLAYFAYLDRDPDPAGRTFYVDAWRKRTRTLELVVSAIVGSNEYFTFNGGNDNAFVTAAYFDILGHEPTPGELASGLATVKSSSRGYLAKQLESSTERRRQIVTDAYGTFLGRVPSDAERDYWVGRLQNGLRREFFDVAILVSNEYYNANS